MSIFHECRRTSLHKFLSADTARALPILVLSSFRLVFDSTAHEAGRRRGRSQEALAFSMILFRSSFRCPIFLSLSVIPIFSVHYERPQARAFAMKT